MLSRFALSAALLSGCLKHSPVYIDVDDPRLRSPLRKALMHGTACAGSAPNVEQVVAKIVPIPNRDWYGFTYFPSRRVGEIEIYPYRNSSTTDPRAAVKRSMRTTLAHEVGHLWAHGGSPLLDEGLAIYLQICMAERSRAFDFTPSRTVWEPLRLGGDLLTWDVHQQQTSLQRASAETAAFRVVRATAAHLSNLPLTWAGVLDAIENCSAEAAAEMQNGPQSQAAILELLPNGQTPLDHAMEHCTASSIDGGTL